jgi:hypothetical protein
LKLRAAEEGGFGDEEEDDEKPATEDHIAQNVFLVFDEAEGAAPQVLVTGKSLVNLPAWFGSKAA